MTGFTHGGSETGFLRKYGLLCADSGKNPVSWCDAGAQKPGFCQDIRCDAQIHEKTRFLGVTQGLRNRVFAKIFIATRRFAKKPGFSGRSA
ncbi:MAG: hypothetical protein EAZ60_20845 [Oscillatoriales cyanobacterium]|nr:MAG: hypothetical protein EAZ83_02800 [Oscillatoriales cyanobacterium]TAF00305.1 MAG: hypothetical protein EAZ79_03195 [Oscillatoriales cyanobacterium]TAF19398.1 MAG: hypothetical protein EAZ73_15530 [Oscillatoriales cyanobacterium]TAF37059.1 MAG: hypothetical protein EAZ69_08355 [Oscillatoriales cyanobacterium]TAF53323.1 MAG: hypothetical protein EAZ60_20845 [Oscillatoriales cyanobacterium]